jgi:hypothetical protein
VGSANHADHRDEIIGAAQVERTDDTATTRQMSQKGSYGRCRLSRIFDVRYVVTGCGPRRSPNSMAGVRAPVSVHNKNDADGDKPLTAAET